MNTPALPAARAIRVMIADDHTLFRQGVAQLLGAAGMRVIGQVATGRDAVRHALNLHPDVTLLDLDMPGLNSLDVLGAMLEADPASRVIAIAEQVQVSEVLAAKRAGARGYLAKTATADELTVLIRAVDAGEWVFERPAAPIQHRCRSGTLEAAALGRREHDLLRLLAQGLSNQKMATQLDFSEKTIRNRLSELFATLKVHNRTQAAVYALRTGIAVLH